MQSGYQTSQPEALAKNLAYHQQNVAQQSCAGQSNQIQSGKPATLEIPEQVDRLNSLQGETSHLLASLHQRLASIMPPSSPETSGSNIGGSTRDPLTQLGQQLESANNMARQHNTSLRYLLERIAL